jgi:hypothetical protein
MDEHGRFIGNHHHDLADTVVLKLRVVETVAIENGADTPKPLRLKQIKH